MTVVLSLSRIRKTFGDFVALDDASIDLRQGEVHALLGENGAGKSSLMNIAAGLYTPDAGTCLIEGGEVHLSGPRDARARGVVMVQQHFQLVHTCSVVENVLLANPDVSLPVRFAEGGRQSSESMRPSWALKWIPGRQFMPCRSQSSSASRS